MGVIQSISNRPDRFRKEEPFVPPVSVFLRDFALVVRPAFTTLIHKSRTDKDRTSRHSSSSAIVFFPLQQLSIYPVSIRDRSRRFFHSPFATNGHLLRLYYP